MADQQHDATGTDNARQSPKKTAVVVIHGMGNQSPMETLRRFVEAVWTSVPRLTEPDKPLTWSKRDFVSHSFETRRITTNHDCKGRRADFYELYWAHMMEDTQLSEVISWFKRLFVRGTDRVPPAVKAPWIAGWVGILVLMAVILVLVWLSLLVFLRAHHSVGGAVLMLVPVAAILVVLWYLRHRVLVQVVGDAARYLTPAPQNIAARSRIRAAGLEFLKALHRRDDYDRIIVVAHSLGTVVGYDLLSLLWSDINTRIHHDAANNSQALQAIEEALGNLLAHPEDEAALSAFRVAQKGYFDEVARIAPDAWKVTDFVTLGSPLTHAHFLMEDDAQPLLPSEERAINASWLQAWWKKPDPVTGRVMALFRARAAQRELPLCPPLTEKGHAFTYEAGDHKAPHHAALFAATRWTNIYAPRNNLLWGDVVAGPVASLFGPGVKDVALKGDVAKILVAHVHYWDTGHGDREHLEALQAAMNLLDQPEAEAWERHRKEAARLTGAAPQRGGEARR